MDFNATAQEMMANLARTLEYMAVADMWRGANSLFCGEQIEKEMHRSPLANYWDDFSFWALNH